MNDPDPTCRWCSNVNGERRWRVQSDVTPERNAGYFCSSQCGVAFALATWPDEPVVVEGARHPLTGNPQVR